MFYRRDGRYSELNERQKSICDYVDKWGIIEKLAEALANDTVAERLNLEQEKVKKAKGLIAYLSIPYIKLPQCEYASMEISRMHPSFSQDFIQGNSAEFEYFASIKLGYERDPIAPTLHSALNRKGANNFEYIDIQNTF